MYINIEKKFDLEKENIKNPILLIGWPGIALVAKLAITSIQESLNAKEFMNIQYFDFPAKAVVEKGTLQIPNATVFYKAAEKDDGKVELMNEYTDVDGIAQETYNYLEDIDITIKIRKSISGSTRYFPIRTAGEITSTGFTLSAVMAEDNIAAP